MEGSTKALNPSNHGGGLSHRPCLSLVRHLVLLTFTTVSSSFSQTSDVWIIEKPEHLVVYDVYQQSVESSQSNAIRPFEPVRVIKARDVLGDSMTPCSKVEVGGEMYYLLLNERGHLAGSALLGTVKVFRGVKFLDDTVEVLQSRKILFQDPVKKNSHFLAGGNFCVRYFSVGGTTYAKIIGQEERYGWLQLPGRERGAVWKAAETPQIAQSLSPMIRDRIAKRIRQANLTLSELYLFLSRRTGRKMVVPQWRIQSSGPSMACTFVPDSVAPQFSQSIQTLCTTLQTYLLGTGYDVVSQGNKVLIRRQPHGFE